jgi:ERF superfamily
MTITDAPAGMTPVQAALAPEGASPSAPSGAPDPYLGIIERAARDPAIDIAKLEGLMQLRERMEDRRAKQAFDNAIAAAKGEIPPIVKNRAVDFTNKAGTRTNYRYEDFAGVASAVDPVLARHGLSYRFRTEQTGARLRVTCRISHADGYGEETTLEASNDDSGNKNAIQAVGSAATYLQRYTLKLALGLAASNDDDAQSAGGADSGFIDTDQLVQMQDLLKETKTSNLEAFFLATGAAGFSNMTVPQWNTGMAKLREKQRRAALEAERLAALKAEAERP